MAFIKVMSLQLCTVTLHYITLHYITLCRVHRSTLHADTLSWRERVDQIGTGGGLCERGNEPLNSVKGGEFLD